MKKILGIVLAGVMLFSTAACSPQNSGSDNSASETKEAATAAETVAATLTDQKKSKIDSLMSENYFEGSAYLTQNGGVVWQYANGKDLSGSAIATDTPLPIGSVSKQFCAAAVMTLRDSGKLSTDDTLDKYFPEYTDGKKLTIHNLLSMRSGISDVVNNGAVEGVAASNSYEENRKAVQKAIFNMALTFEPDARYEYSNSNYILLSAIVEKVSGQKYIDYLRSVLLEPFGMAHTGSVDEFEGAATAWAGGLNYSDIAGLATGAGDIISTATDMDKWMTGLRKCTVLSPESLSLMTKNYSSDSAAAYGYGLMLDYKNGVGHPGNIMVAETPFAAFDYFSDEYGYNLIIEGSNQMNVLDLGTDIIEIIYE